MKRVALVALAILVLAGSADAWPAKIERLIAQWKFNVGICEGAPKAEWFSAKTAQACDAEKRYERRLNWLGWCFGRKSDTARYLHDWHRCKADSFHANPEQP